MATCVVANDACGGELRPVEQSGRGLGFDAGGQAVSPQEGRVVAAGVVDGEAGRAAVSVGDDHLSPPARSPRTKERWNAKNTTSGTDIEMKAAAASRWVP